jgi:hypothetical protein
LMQEVSKALPSHCYQDPAKIVEQNQLVQLGCTACTKHAVYFGKVGCTEPRKPDNKGVPRIGSKCKYFELKG